MPALVQVLANPSLKAPTATGRLVYSLVQVVQPVSAAQLER